MSIDLPLPDHTQDGIDHINCYSKGKTWLGQQLSNLSNTPFIHFCKTTNIEFELRCVEQYWYYRKLIPYFPKSTLEPLLNMNGFQAKKFGMELQKTIELTDNQEIINDFKVDIIDCLRSKLVCCKDIRNALEESTLPLRHYYVFNDVKVTDLPQYYWMLDYFDEVRTKLKGARKNVR